MIAQLVKALITKSDDLSSVPGFYIIGERQVINSDLHMHNRAHTHIHTRIPHSPNK